MTAAELIDALELPAAARVSRRIPKTLLVEHGAPTAADKRCISEGIAELQWVATLKPTTIGVPAFRDEVREYLEIAVLHVALLSEAKLQRLGELIHRAVPYPVFLAVSEGDRVAVSLCHKRWSRVGSGDTVLDGEPVAVTLSQSESGGLDTAFCEAVSLARQPRANLYRLYEGWIDTLLALLAGRETGIFAAATSPKHAETRREALRECAQLEVKIAQLRAAATMEKQVPRQVALNLELKRAEAARAAALTRL